MPQTRLVTKLKATSAVTAIVSTRIYPMLRPRDSALPCIVYEVISNSHVNDASGTTTTREMRISLDCIAGTYAGAWALANAVRDNISGWNDTSGDVWHLDSEQDDTETILTGQSEATAYIVSQDYLVWFDES
jgi:hypothetical protein